MFTVDLTDTLEAFTTSKLFDFKLHDEHVRKSYNTYVRVFFKVQQLVCGRHMTTLEHSMNLLENYWLIFN